MQKGNVEENKIGKKGRREGRQEGSK